MGYGMHMAGKATFRVPVSRHAEALNAIAKAGFKAATTLVHTLEYTCWYPKLDAEYNIIGLLFHGENLHDEDKLFAALGPFVEGGGCIEMVGEDGDRWRWTFDGNVMRKMIPRVAWE